MKFKGTPGPWSVEGYWVESDSRCIAEVHDFKEECEIFKPVHPESAANADLIAAAPELLEALQDALHAHDKHGEHSEWDFARAAIAKALGK